MPKKRSRGEGTIYRRKDGRYEAALTVGTTEGGNPKRKRVYGKTEKEVLAKLNDLRFNYQRGTLPNDDGVTLERWMLEWHASRKHQLAGSTQRSYEDLMKRHVFPRLGKTKLAQLKPLDLRNLYTALAQGGLSKRTQDYIHGLIFSALKSATQLEVVPRNVAEVVRPAGKSRRAEIAVWEAEQVQRFLTHIHEHRLFAVYYLILALGLRRGEVLALRWSDIDLARRALWVRRTYSRGADGSYGFKRPKTASSERELHFSVDDAQVLHAHQQRQAEERGALAASEWAQPELVFTTEIGTPLHPDNLRRPLQTAAQKASIPPISIHGLRHTYTTLALSQTVRPLAAKLVSQRLGHSDVAFTLRVYQHVFERQHEEAALSMDQLLGVSADAA